MGRTMEFVELLHLAQEYISKHYAASLTEKSKFPQIKTYLEKYLRDNGFTVDGMTTNEVTNKLYSEMAEYSILTKYLGKDEIEEININGWDDVAITYTDGHIEKAQEHFYSPQHAIDIVKRLLHHSGMIIDNATPMSQGHLPGNTRITALKEPLVDDDRGISVSIRLLHPTRVNREELVRGGNSTQKMIDFELSNTHQELMRNIVRAILLYDCKDENYLEIYKQWKSLRKRLNISDEEIADYCEFVDQKGRDALYYLSDLTKLEKEKAIKLIGKYQAEYDNETLLTILKNNFPDFYDYVCPFYFNNSLLDKYFSLYTMQKLRNVIYPEFENLVNVEAEEQHFVELPSRSEIVGSLDKTDSILYRSI